jgi:aminopeptidase N
MAQSAVDRFRTAMTRARMFAARVPVGRWSGLTQAGYLSGHGSWDYSVERYELELDYRVAGERLAGRAVLHATARTELSRVRLDFGEFRVARVLVDGQPARFRYGGGKLVVALPRKSAVGTTFTVEVRYAGRPAPVRSHWGGLGWEPLADGVLVASQPTGAPSWFPCNDRPGDKAGYRISVTTPARYHVLANGVLVDSRVSAGNATWVYEQAEPMAAYLATVHIGLSGQVELAPGQSAVLPPDAVPAFRHDFLRQPEMMTLFTELFGPYPFAGYGVLVVDDELDIPVEAQGISIFGRNHLDRRRGSETLVAHELAHQWFGNSLTVTDWQHIWLNEGFAQYAEWLWSERSGQRSADRCAREAWTALSRQPQDLVLSDPGWRRIFDDRVYVRGALTVHVLRRAIGDAAFFALLLDWTDRYRHATVDTPSFCNLALTHSGLAGPAAVTALFARWLHAAPLPPLPH